MLKSIIISSVLSLLFYMNTNAQTIKPLEVGDKFPSISGSLLSSKKITLPEHCSQKIAVLIVAFKRGTQPQIDTWIKPLMKEFSMYDDFRFIEIPMISNFYSWMSNYIDNGMRKGIVPSMHKNVMTYYGPLSDYYTYFDVDDKTKCYVFLLDKTGKIQYKIKGKADSHQLTLISEKIKSLLHQ